MKENIFEEPALRAIVSRFHLLTADHTARWGKMTVGEMIYHCREALTLIMRAEPSNKSSTFRQNVLRVLFLYIIKKFPKEAGTPKEIDVRKSKVIVRSIEEEKQLLINKLEVFVMQQKIYAMHPYFGKLSRNEWGIFTWMHLDHHLRQFGV